MDEVSVLPEILVTDTEMLDVHDIPVSQEKPKVKQDELYYAVATNSYDPISDWKKANEEVVRTGESSLYNVAQQKWQEEQNNTAKAVLIGIMLDTTVPDFEKKAALNTYISGGFLSSSLRDKYLVEQATRDNAVTQLDRNAQDILADSVYKRDQAKAIEENARLIEKAEVGVKEVLKGTGAVGSQLTLMVPAGYAAILGLIMEQDNDAAAEIMKSVQEMGYNPTDAGSQKVVEKIQWFMDKLDIPFKWAGDQVLDLTGSPGAATAVYTASSMAGYAGAYKAVKGATGAVIKGVRKGSPLDTTATANRPNATELAAAAVADSTGELARAMGTTREAIISDYTLTKLTDDLADRPDLVDALVRTDRALSGITEEVRIDPNIYPVTKIMDEKEAYLAVMQETTGPKLLTSRSVLDFVWDENTTYLKGKAMFGRNEHYGFETEMAADYAARQLELNTANLPVPGVVSVVKRGDEHFIQWEFTRPYEPLEQLTFGKDFLHTDVMGMDVTRFANSAIGEWIWPAFMRMKSWVPSIGAMGGWKQARMEKEFLLSQKELVHLTPHKIELNKILRQGETEGKVFSLAEVKAKFPHLSTKEAQDLYTSYYGYRRIEDHMYVLSDRKKRKLLNDDGYEAMYSPTGERLGFASSKIPLNEPIKKIWDFNTKAVVERTPDMPIVKLHDAVKVGDNLYNYAMLGRNQLGPIQPGSLTKIPGYITRQYKEWFVVEKEPKKLEVDGDKITPEKLRDYRVAAAMAKNKGEAAEIQTRLSAEDPNYTYHVRPERKDIEDKIMFDSKIYDSFYSEHEKRGDRLNGLNRQADIEDVLVAQTKAIMSLSRLEAFSPYMEHFRKQFVKEYGDFTGHEFPEQINDIKPKSRMTDAEARRFLSAQKAYKQAEMQQFSTIPSDEMWKGAFGAIAEVFEKTFLKALGPFLREAGNKGIIPIKLAKSLGSHMWLYMRPQRMWIVQPQQMLELSTISPGFAKQAMADGIHLFNGMLARASIMSKLRPAMDDLGRGVVKEYDACIDAMIKTGIMQAVDTNMMIHGIWKDSMEELVPSKVTQVAQNMKKAALVPSKVGRAVGYDPSELLNQVTIWMFSKHKWVAENPGKNWNTPENIAEIGQLTWRMGHGASTRAGMMPMQEGVLSLMGQFLAIPHKSFMQSLSSPDLTTANKAKLFGARLFWYGKWGVPGGAAMYAMLEQYMPEETAENLHKYTGGVSDLVMKTSFELVTGEEANVQWAKSTSTVPEKLYMWDTLETVYNIALGNKENNAKYPFMNATTSFFQAANELYDMYKVPVLRGDEPDWALTVQRGTEFYLGWGGGMVKDFGEALMLEQITKTGQLLGHQMTTGEAMSKFFGVQTDYEAIIWDAFRVKGKREKFIDSTAKEIHDRAMKARLNGASELKDYWYDVKSFIQLLPEEYHDDMVKSIQKWDRTSQVKMGDSMAMYLLDNYTTENDGFMTQLRNKLSNTDDPRLKQVNEVLK